MIRFNDFITEEFLSESLNSPVEFYMTDDTEMPRRIYATFDIDGTTYGMSLEESNFTKVYFFKLYRVVNVKPRLWSFKKPAHIRKALSTALKFMEACVPFIKTRMDAIICPIPASTQAARLNTFVQRMIKRSYIKTFRGVPVKRISDAKDAYERFFIIRKQVNPKTLFKTKSFKKYEFDPSDDVPAEVLDDIEPKRRPKMRVSFTRSEKFQFKGMEVKEITIDDDILEQVVSIEETGNTEKWINESPTEEDKVEYYSIRSKMNEKFAIQLIAHVLPDAYKKFKNSDGGAAAKNEFKQAMYDLTFDDKKEYSPFYILFRGAGVVDILDSINNHPEVIEPDEQVVSNYERFNELSEKINSTSKDIKGVSTGMTNIDPSQFSSEIPGSGKFDYNKFKSTSAIETAEMGEDLNAKKDYVKYDLGYDRYFEDPSQFSRDSYEAIKSYTGDGHEKYNASIRDLANYVFSNKTAPKLVVERFSNEELKNVIKGFDNVKPFPEPLWVYRSCRIPEDIMETLRAGHDFVDPGIMSTSLQSDIVFDGKDKLRIFIPKGSKVIPFLTHSKHPNENEVILPPFSLLKVIRIDTQENDMFGDQNYVTCVFTGSMYQSFIDKLNLNESNEKFDNMASSDLIKKTQSMINNGIYNPGDKFGDMADPMMIKKIQDAIRNGKIKKRKH